MQLCVCVKYVWLALVCSVTLSVSHVRVTLCVDMQCCSSVLTGAFESLFELVWAIDKLAGSMSGTIVDSMIEEYNIAQPRYCTAEGWRKIC